MKTILISVAHSSVSRGAVNGQGHPNEYDVSRRASEQCFRSLSGECAVELFDCGPLKPGEYDKVKVERVNMCKPSLAVEIHCNAGPPQVSYSETIYATDEPSGRSGKMAAQLIADAIGAGFSAGRHSTWKNHGARADDRNLFFLQRTIVPAVIVEGLFITNDEQAAWLASNGGYDTYGILVAEGIKRWLKESA